MAYKRVLLKLSGEVFGGESGAGLDRGVIEKLVTELKSAAKATGAEIAVVVGGGNIMRARSDSGQAFERVTADYMGIIATVINGLAIVDVSKAMDVKATLLSRLDIPKVAKSYTADCGRKKLAEGKLLIIAGGTGNPYVTTDTASVLSALELGCEVVLKATKVDGVYDKDPAQNPDATKLDKLTFSEAAQNPEITVMDDAAFIMAKENKMPIVVFDWSQPGNIQRAIATENIGTTITD